MAWKIEGQKYIKIEYQVIEKERNAEGNRAGRNRSGKSHRRMEELIVFKASDSKVLREIMRGSRTKILSQGLEGALMDV